MEVQINRAVEKRLQLAGLGKLVPTPSGASVDTDDSDVHQEKKHKKNGPAKGKAKGKGAHPVDGYGKKGAKGGKGGDVIGSRSSLVTTTPDGFRYGEGSKPFYRNKVMALLRTVDSNLKDGDICLESICSVKSGGAQFSMCLHKDDEDHNSFRAKAHVHPQWSKMKDLISSKLPDLLRP
jgi:hypothetical protein